MYRFACFVSGVAIAVMVAINGNLTGYYGVYTATVIIHLAGLLFLFLALKGAAPAPVSGVQNPRMDVSWRRHRHFDDAV